MTTHGNRAFWQSCAGWYDRAVKKHCREQYARVCELIRAKLTPDMCVLELACGSGQLSYPLSGCVDIWEATDYSQAMIQAAERGHNIGGLRFAVQDATALPYEHGTFDAVVIGNALHVMPEPEKALFEIRRVLKPGGRLFAPTGVYGGRRSFRFRLFLLKFLGFRVYHKWTPMELKGVIEENGFRVDSAIVLRGDLAPLCYIEAVSTK